MRQVIHEMIDRIKDEDALRELFEYVYAVFRRYL